MTGSSGEDAEIPELEIEVPPKPEFARVARHSVAAVARLHDLSDDVADDIRLAVSEACTTAILAREPNGEGSALVVRARTDGERMTVDLVDPSATQLREIDGPPGDLDTEDLPFEKLLAVPVIRGLVDELRVSPHEGGGTRLRMVISTEAGPE
jgi:serine/threonine-protein kinase RsbW